MVINRQDTNGVKPLLQTGELGFDNFASGGDKGRVYVGAGTVNIALAKKSEVDVKVVANVDITAGTATKVTYDAKGLVTSGTNPTTLSGYGITDADTSAQVTTKINNAVAALVDASPTTEDLYAQLALKAPLVNPAFTNPTATTQAAQDNSTKVATTAYVYGAVLGLGQTLQTFTVGTQRVAGNIYTNSSGKPIWIIIGMSAGAGASLSVTAGGALRVQSVPDSGSPTRVIVPILNGESYSATSSVGTINYWAEIR